MKVSYFNIAVAFLLLISGVLFALSLKEFDEYKKREIESEQLQENMRTVIPFNVNEVLDSLTHFVSNNKEKIAPFGQAEYAAVFVLNSNVCRGCILEVHDWLAIIESFKVKDIQPVIIVLENDDDSVKNFLNRSKFNAASFWGHHKHLDQITQLTTDALSLPQMIAFVDLTQNQIFSRSIISTRITNLDYKQKLLNDIFSQ